ncbi:GNAT family N-acetyltransferase [Cupriavidus taiwanensis]|uniref:GNAT family N-acetyltransferase n=1 Tax=Cupriavidus taiwanensis TaxID=164546 RepID=UPI000E191841|nr:GNAT family N-acetyltransferase [Cupriavidus taiwanensis]SPC14000.1 N-acetylglutamate synthase [Cupriavidus taiwanensis]
MATPSTVLPHPPMNIRRGLETDASILTAIAFQAKAHWPYTAAQLEAWREDLTIPGAYVAQTFTYVAEINGRIAGFCTVRATDAMSGWPLEHLWVVPDYMGRGIGRALLQHASGLAAATGVKQLTIDAEPYAEPFYIACGARRIGVIDAPLDGNPSRQRPQMLLATSLD